MSLLVNFCLYQTGWFAIVLGAANERPWLGMACALTLVGGHLVLVRGVVHHLALMVASAALGFTIDSLLLWLGVFRFPGSGPSQWLAPPWEVVLWMQFSTILPFCLRWLSRRYVLSSVLGFVGGPLAFYAGEGLGAVSFLEPRALHFVVLGVAWALAFPSLVWLSDTLVVGLALASGYRFGSEKNKTPAACCSGPQLGETE